MGPTKRRTLSTRTRFVEVKISHNTRQLQIARRILSTQGVRIKAQQGCAGRSHTDTLLLTSVASQNTPWWVKLGSQVKGRCAILSLFYGASVRLPKHSLCPDCPSWCCWNDDHEQSTLSAQKKVKTGTQNHFVRLETFTFLRHPRN